MDCVEDRHRARLGIKAHVIDLGDPLHKICPARRIPRPGKSLGAAERPERPERDLVLSQRGRHSLQRGVMPNRLRHSSLTTQQRQLGRWPIRSRMSRSRKPSGTDGSQTRRWSKADSNSWSHHRWAAARNRLTSSEKGGARNRRRRLHRFPAGSFFGGFRTSALYRVHRSRRAGIRNPTRKQTCITDEKLAANSSVISRCSGAFDLHMSAPSSNRGHISGKNGVVGAGDCFGVCCWLFCRRPRPPPICPWAEAIGPASRAMPVSTGDTKQV
jgi:hypothetical protein